MLFKVNQEVQGRFQLKVYKADGTLKTDTGWFNNLVLDQGLNIMATNSWFNGVAVGTGNSEPIASQVKLDAESARTNKSVAGSTEKGALLITGTTDYYHWHRSAYRFAAGVFKNVNLAEVGITSQAGTLWNRALLKDTEGNPTTITVLEDEYLDVIVEFRVYCKDEEITGTIDMVNKKGVLIRKVGYKVKPADINKQHPVTVSIGTSGRYDFGYAQAYDGTIGVSTGRPNGTIIEDFRGDLGSHGFRPYIQSSFELECVLTASIANMNGKSLRSIFLAGCLSSYQIEFDTPIVKDNTQTFTFSYKITWGRYTGD